MSSFSRVFGWLLGLLLLSSCRFFRSDREKDSGLPNDTLTAVERLHERGSLIAVTDQPELNYRLQEGRPAGFQLELLDDFCESNQLSLILLTNDSLEESLTWLRHGEIDLCAVTIDSTTLQENGFHYVSIPLPREREQELVWVIRQQAGDSSLLKTIQQWIVEEEPEVIKSNYYRYFKKRTLGTNYISPYDKLIKAEAQRIGWDWRLIASIIYQESRFNPELQSHKGAFGLMQLMPVIMERYDIDDESTLEEHLEAGGKLLLHIEQQLPESITDSVERQYFILAAYNAGLGQLLDARQQAEEQGRNPDMWTDNVEQYVPRQTYRFVREVSKRYSHYKALIE